MLPRLAKIAKQLESDGHLALADQVDEIITIIGARQPFGYAEPGDLWSEEQEGMEADPEEQSADIEAAGLNPHESDEIGLGYTQGYSEILLKHKGAFKRWLKHHPIVKMVARGNKNPDLFDEPTFDALRDDLEHIFDELASYFSKGGKVVADDGFRDVSTMVIKEVLAEAAAAIA